LVVVVLNQFSAFFAAIADDPRVNTTHICLYMALLHYWKDQSLVCPMHVFSHGIMQKAKISSSATYHKSIRDLHHFGYIKYMPSFKKNQGSKIYMVWE
jgi:hypothetical protein